MKRADPKTTESEISYERLHEAILSGELLPHERLIETELAERFGVGRAAIRTALARLEQDGLVEHEPHRGAKVRAISEQEAIEILEVRSVLEGLIARYAAINATLHDLHALQTITTTMEQELANGDLLRISELNSQFHDQLLKMARHQTTERLLERLRPHHVRYEYRTILMPGRAPHSLEEHRQILTALTNHDPDAAEQAMRTHLRHVVEALRTTILIKQSRR
ncbi:MAG: GntR family transcriptional regulator [Roseiflexaceae bacterium]